MSTKGSDAGRAWARRNIPLTVCITCGRAATERHHVGGDTSDRDPARIQNLCRPCHWAQHPQRRDRRGRFAA